MGFDFELRDDSIGILRNRHEVGITWKFLADRDEDREEVSEEFELPAALSAWNTETLVYAQGPENRDISTIGFIMPDQFEGIGTIPELNIAAERIVRAELARVGITAGATSVRVEQTFTGESTSFPMIPIVF